ncbi:hypothetical protein ACJX0J_040843, partial [Zea mays]
TLGKYQLVTPINTNVLSLFFFAFFIQKIESTRCTQELVATVSIEYGEAHFLYNVSCGHKVSLPFYNILDK